MSEKEKLARLESVDPDVFWKTEQDEFTPWLTDEENLNLLADTLGLELVFEKREAPAGEGRFKADILCVNTEDDSKVVIENQLTKTDHDHLGKMITYASALRAQTVIWVAKTFRDEHRAALDWLNEITVEDRSFFGVEIKLWKIEDSPLAPEFNIVCKPNDWSRTTRRSASENPSDLELLRREYWNQFVEYLEAQKSPLLKIKSRKAPNVNMRFRLRKSGVRIEARRKKEQHVQVTLVLTGENAIARFKLLEEKNLNGLGDRLQSLQSKENRKSCGIWLEDDQAALLENKEDWPRQFEWLDSTLQCFDEVFRPLINEIDPADWDPAEDDEDE